jgi:hypothetical protein
MKSPNLKTVKSFLIVDLLDINTKATTKMTESVDGDQSATTVEVCARTIHEKFSKNSRSDHVTIHLNESTHEEYLESSEESSYENAGASSLRSRCQSRCESNNKRSHYNSQSRSRSRSRSCDRSRSHSRSSSSSSCNLKKNRKSRTAFSDYQLNSLEKSFEKHKYLSVQDRVELATKLNLTDTQVKTWYQNRR